jgi:hypothetical protein
LIRKLTNGLAPLVRGPTKSDRALGVDPTRQRRGCHGGGAGNFLFSVLPGELRGHRGGPAASTSAAISYFSNSTPAPGPRQPWKRVLPRICEHLPAHAALMCRPAPFLQQTSPWNTSLFDGRLLVTMGTSAEILLVGSVSQFSKFVTRGSSGERWTFPRVRGKLKHGGTPVFTQWVLYG